MYDSFNFIGGILGTFLGSLATLVYHMRQIRQHARQNYIRLSLAQAEVATLERILEIHRYHPVTDFTQPLQDPAESESEASHALPPIPPWIGHGESPIADGMTSEQTVSQAGET